jgi:hypothetical protein
MTRHLDRSFLLVQFGAVWCNWVQFEGDHQLIHQLRRLRLAVRNQVPVDILTDIPVRRVSY